MPRLIALLLLLATALGLSSPGRAAESRVATTIRDQVSLVSSLDRVAPGQSFDIGLRVHLMPGWHIYWSNPGDAGLAPSLKLTLPAGATAGPLRFPAPHRLAEGPVTVYGYEGDVLLPLSVTPPPGGTTLPITAAANWLVCRDVCVPEEAEFTLTLPLGSPTEPSREAALFAAGAATMPQLGLRAWLAPDGTLTATGEALATAPAHAYFFPAAPGLIDQDAKQAIDWQPGRLSVKLAPQAGLHAGDTLTGILAIRAADNRRQTFAIAATPGQPTAATSSAPPLPAPDAVPAAVKTGLLAALGAALLGGLILNLMPCVFPILAMKAAHLSRLSAAHAARRQVAEEGLAYTAGTVLSFLAIGGIMLALREGGDRLGWGFQFQSPVFVVLITWLLFAVGLGFSGIIAPRGRWAGLGQSLTVRAGMIGSFCTGILSGLVAAPCTTPFLGAALAAALAAPPATGLGIFAMLGLGLALPFLAISLVPGLGRLLPRPGRWMEVLRQALAFPIYASVLWLIWVAGRAGGGDLLLLSGIGILLIGFAAWAAPLGRRIGPAFALLAVLALVPVALRVPTQISGQPIAARVVGAEPFSESRLAALRAAGKPVFVDLTAAWCVSCLVNETVALNRPEVRAGFKARGVAYLIGDWTRGDPAITAFLRRHRRDGVPLYVYYPVGGEAQLLPQLLTPGIVLRAIGAAAG